MAALAGAAAPVGAAPAGGAPADSAARRTGPARMRWSEQPRFVMLRSALVPGWGQAHNRAWIKAVAVAGVESYLLSALVHDNRVLSDLQDEIDAIPDTLASLRNPVIERYNARVEKFVGRQWLLGGLLAYALVDAYVDAHFRNFDLEFRQDPALPDAPAAPPGSAGSAAVREGTTRLALRWHF